MAETQVLRVTLDELRKLVAEHVYGWKWLRGAEVPEALRHDHEWLDRQEVWVDQEGNAMACKFCGNMPPWESDHNAAFEVIDRIQEQNPAWEFHLLGNTSGGWWGNLREYHDDPSMSSLRVSHSASGPTRPITICKVALATKGIHVEVVS